MLPVPTPVLLNAVTVTLNGEPALLAYVCVGVESVVAVVVSPSPQLIVNRFALPTTVVARVAVNPAPPETISETKSTDLTYVSVLMFSTISARSEFCVSFAPSKLLIVVSKNILVTAS